MRIRTRRRLVACGAAVILGVLGIAAAAGGTVSGTLHEDRALVTVPPDVVRSAATSVARPQAFSLQRLEAANRDYIVTPRPTSTPTPSASRPARSWNGGGGIPAADDVSVAAVEAIITAAAQAAGVDPAWMLNTAGCESGFRAGAYSAAGPYVGIFQFLPSTFAAHGGTDIWSPAQQASIAARMFASGGAGAWPVCSRR